MKEKAKEDPSLEGSAARQGVKRKMKEKAKEDPCVKGSAASQGIKRKLQLYPSTSEASSKIRASLNEFSEFIGEVYPRENLTLPLELKNATLDIGSIEKLYPKRPLNDLIINFYCQYLMKIKILKQPVEFTIYSSYFYASLERYYIPNKQFDMQRIQRQKSINIFEKQFVLFPINFLDIHWVTCVICHPCQIKSHLRPLASSSCDSKKLDTEPFQVMYNVSSSKDEVINNQKMPCILVFDSLKEEVDETISPTEKRPFVVALDTLKKKDKAIFPIVRRYICDEYKRLYQVSPDLQDLPGYFVQCPQQKNVFDCGVHGLMDIEMVLDHHELFEKVPPPNLRDRYDRNSVCHKRVEMLTLIMDLIKKAKEK